MNDIKELANLYYDFVKEYDYKLEKFDYESSYKDVEAIQRVYSDLYIAESLMKVLGYDKECAIKQLTMMLQDLDDTLELRDILVNIFGPIDSYIYKIQNLDYITHDVVSKKQLSIIVNRYFENDSRFKEKDYFNLYLKFDELRDKLNLHATSLKNNNCEQEEEYEEDE